MDTKDMLKTGRFPLSAKPLGFKGWGWLNQVLPNSGLFDENRPVFPAAVRPDPGNLGACFSFLVQRESKSKPTIRSGGMKNTDRTLQLVNGGLHLFWCGKSNMFQMVAKWRSFKEPWILGTTILRNPHTPPLKPRSFPQLAEKTLSLFRGSPPKIISIPSQARPVPLRLCRPPPRTPGDFQSPAPAKAPRPPAAIRVGRRPVFKWHPARESDEVKKPGTRFTSRQSMSSI